MDEDKFSVAMTDRNDWGQTMTITRNGVVKYENTDCGEPEDNLFCRDWSWVEDAINDAYRWGLEDGRNGK